MFSLPVRGGLQPVALLTGSAQDGLLHLPPWHSEPGNSVCALHIDCLPGSLPSTHSTPAHPHLQDHENVALCPLGDRPTPG